MHKDTESEINLIFSDIIKLIKTQNTSPDKSKALIDEYTEYYARRGIIPVESKNNTIFNLAENIKSNNIYISVKSIAKLAYMNINSLASDLFWSELVRASNREAAKFINTDQYNPFCLCIQNLITLLDDIYHENKEKNNEIST